MFSKHKIAGCVVQFLGLLIFIVGVLVGITLLASAHDAMQTDFYNPFRDDAKAHGMAVIGAVIFSVSFVCAIGGLLWHKGFEVRQ